MDHEAVMDEAQACRLAAGRYDQLGMHEIARMLRENARCAERWLAAPNDAARQRIRMSLSAPLVIRHALLLLGQ